MTDIVSKPALPFVTRKKSQDIPLLLLTEKAFRPWLKKQSEDIKAQTEEAGFDPAGKTTLTLRNTKGRTAFIIAGLNGAIQAEDGARIAEQIAKTFSAKYLKNLSISLDTKLKAEEQESFLLGWALAAYRFELYKNSDNMLPQLVWPKGVEKKRIETITASISLLRDLINTPANDLTTEALEKAVKAVAKNHAAKVKIIKGQALLDQNFPLIHAVGRASTQEPRLIELHWGKTSDPKLTLVGKGVTFDTGGLNIKPTQYMALMKKDMGGAAHALALANIVMALNLPVRLRLLIPAVENAIAGNAFRPGDIIKSRKGLTVENTNTDAEGRLILADSLAYACEDKPDLLIDFATLTGSARAALGPDIPAAFATTKKLRSAIENASEASGDPVWVMPLWQDYRKHIKSQHADLVNSASLPGDLIYSALFLQSFVTENTPWIHLDCYAWEQQGKPGRPKGGAETGLLAMLALIENMGEIR